MRVKGVGEFDGFVDVAVEDGSADFWKVISRVTSCDFGIPLTLSVHSIMIFFHGQVAL